MKNYKQTKKFKINLQFFAEDGNDGLDGNENPDNKSKTYSEEEYQKLKLSFDKTASELANLKKELKEGKLSQEEINQKLRDYESKFEDFELKDELMKANIFTSEEVEEIIAKKESKKELLNNVVSLVKVKIEEEKKNAIAEFMKKSDVSGGSGENQETIDEDVESFINSKKKDSTSKAREYYLNKK